MSRKERGRPPHQRAAPGDKTATKPSVNVKGTRPALTTALSVAGTQVGSAESNQGGAVLTGPTIPKGKGVVSAPFGRRKLWAVVVWNRPWCNLLHLHRSGPKALFNGAAIRVCVVNGGRYVLHAMGGAG
jgi:hypothetical protein